MSRFICVGLLVTLLACGGSDSADVVAPPPPLLAAIVQVVEGDRQIDTVAQQLAIPIRIRVLTDTRAPVTQQLVNFVVVSGGGSVFAGSALTDANGEALERWTLGTTAGAHTLEARAVDQDTGQPITFASITATALPGPAAAIALRRADITAFLNAALDLRAMIQGVTDAYGNAIADPVPTATGAGTYTVANGSLTATAEGDLSLTLRVDAASALVVVRIRRDLRVVADWSATWGCRNGSGSNSSAVLSARHNDIGGWSVLSYDATAIVTLTYEVQSPFDPSRRSDGTVLVNGTAHGTWQSSPPWPIITDTLTQTFSATSSFWQHPDSVVFRRGFVLNSDLGPSFARWVGDRIEGADWCTGAGSFYAGAVFRGTDGQLATAGSFIPLVLRP